MRKM
ncbi:Protein CBG27104 [Caenorhabditis briggsae]|jgi:hypothetical protein